MTNYFNPLAKTRILQTKTLKELAGKSSRFKTELIVSVGRFLGKDWGDVTAYDIYLNNKSLQAYQIVRAQYETHKGIVVITAFPNSENTAYQSIVMMQEAEEDSVCLSA